MRGNSSLPLALPLRHPIRRSGFSRGPFFALFRRTRQSRTRHRGALCNCGRDSSKSRGGSPCLTESKLRERSRLPRRTACAHISDTFHPSRSLFAAENANERFLVGKNGALDLVFSESSQFNQYVLLNQKTLVCVSDRRFRYPGEPETSGKAAANAGLGVSRCYKSCGNTKKGAPPDGRAPSG